MDASEFKEYIFGMLFLKRCSDQFDVVHAKVIKEQADRQESAEYSKHELLLPPLPEQRRIVEVLDAIGDQIYNLHCLIDKGLHVKKGLLCEVSERAFVKCELVSLSDLSVSITGGSRGWAQYYSDSGALFIRIGNLTREHINLHLRDLVWVRPPVSSEGSRTNLLHGDVLISITADLGIIGVVPKNLGDAYVNQHVAMVRASKSVNSRWMGHMLSSDRAQKQFQLANDSGAKAGLNLPSIGRICIPMPPRIDQDKVSAALDERDAVV